jgi:hypothetical protein
MGFLPNNYTYTGPQFLPFRLSSRSIHPPRINQTPRFPGYGPGELGVRHIMHIKLIIPIVCIGIMGCSSQDRTTEETKPTKKYIIDQYAYVENAMGTKACLVVKDGIDIIDGIESSEYKSNDSLMRLTVTGKVTVTYKDGSRIIWDNGIILDNIGHKIIEIK